MVPLQYIGGIMGIIANIFLFIAIYKNKENQTKVEQNFCFWMCLAILDIIVLITTIIKDGNYLLPLSFAIGSICITFLLLYKKQIEWTIIETITIIFIFICLIIWWQFGEKAAIISSVTAISFCYLPQIKDTQKNPEKTPTKIYLIFTLSETISIVGGRDWSVQEQLYAISQLIAGLIIILFSLKKKKI